MSDGIPEGNISLMHAHWMTRDTIAAPGASERPTENTSAILETLQGPVYLANAYPTPALHVADNEAMNLLCCAFEDGTLVAKYRDAANLVCTLAPGLWADDNAKAIFSELVLTAHWKVFPTSLVGHAAYVDEPKLRQWLRGVTAGSKGGRGNINAGGLNSKAMTKSVQAATAWLVTEYMSKSKDRQTHTQYELSSLARLKFPPLSDRKFRREAWRKAAEKFPAWSGGGTPPKR